MHEEDDGEKRIYASSLASMVLEAILAVIISMVIALAAIIVKSVDNPVPTFVAVTAAGTLLGVIIVLFRRVVVTVSETQVTLRSPGAVRTLERAKYIFSPFTQRTTYQGLPFWNARSLRATGVDGEDAVFLSLPNFSAKEFALLIADVRRPAERSGEGGNKERFTVEYTTPKTAILAEHRKMGRIALVTLVVIAAIVAAITGSVTGAAIGCGVIWFAVWLVIGSEYRGVEKRMPERIVIDGENVSFDEDVYQLAEGLVITATPPNYPKSAHLTTRIMKISGAWGEKGKYNFSLCPNKGNGKYVYGEYGDLCAALEHASHIHNFLVTYDL